MSAQVWTTATYPVRAQYEAWRRALNLSHLEWELDPASEPAFGARVRQRTLDDVRVVDCRCDPCLGRRGRMQTGRGNDAYFGILFELEGREVIRQDGNEAILRAGDFVMWDSEREMEFKVLDPLHKLTLLIPKPRMKAFLGDGERYAGLVVSGSARVDGLASEALRRLARDFVGMDEGAATTVIDPVLSLLSATLMSRRPVPKVSAGHLDSFRTFCRYIEQNLGDESLSPSRVAAAHRTSLRYLHLVFAEQGASVAQWMRQRRLSHCHRELSQVRRGETITEVAFRWGFNDMAHFSRTFKAQYGVSPRGVCRPNASESVEDQAEIAE